MTQAGTGSYAYDANGNMRCGNAATGSLNVSYDAFNLPLVMSRNGNQATFRYGSDQQRYYQAAGSVSFPFFWTFPREYSLEFT